MSKVTSCGNCPMCKYVDREGFTFAKSGYRCGHPALERMEDKYRKDFRSYRRGNLRKEPERPRVEMSWKHVPAKCPLRNESVTVSI